MSLSARTRLIIAGAAVVAAGLVVLALISGGDRSQGTKQQKQAARVAAAQNVVAYFQAVDAGAAPARSALARKLAPFTARSVLSQSVRTNRPALVNAIRSGWQPFTHEWIVVTKWGTTAVVGDRADVEFTGYVKVQRQADRAPRAGPLQHFKLHLHREDRRWKTVEESEQYLEPYSGPMGTPGDQSTHAHLLVTGF
jgi:hypothetical protein